jgi:hypothetical protein
MAHEHSTDWTTDFWDDPPEPMPAATERRPLRDADLSLFVFSCFRAFVANVGRRLINPYDRSAAASSQPAQRG